MAGGTSMISHVMYIVKQSTTRRGGSVLQKAAPGAAMRFFVLEEGPGSNEFWRCTVKGGRVSVLNY